MYWSDTGVCTTRVWGRCRRVRGRGRTGRRVAGFSSCFPRGGAGDGLRKDELKTLLSCLVLLLLLLLLKEEVDDWDLC